VRLHFCGTRGSTPAFGAEFLRYGGHTSCVAVAHDTDEVPTLILDAGTGLREVTSAGQPFAGTILLSHLHWDHVHGLPFFRGGDTEGPGSRCCCRRGVLIRPSGRWRGPAAVTAVCLAHKIQARITVCVATCGAPHRRYEARTG